MWTIFNDHVDNLLSSHFDPVLASLTHLGVQRRAKGRRWRNGTSVASNVSGPQASETRRCELDVQCARMIFWNISHRNVQDSNAAGIELQTQLHWAEHWTLWYPVNFELNIRQCFLGVLLVFTVVHINSTWILWYLGMISGVVLLGDLGMRLHFALPLSSSAFKVSIYDNINNINWWFFDLLRTDADSCTEEVEGHVQWFVGAEGSSWSDKRRWGSDWKGCSSDFFCGKVHESMTDKGMSS